LEILDCGGAGHPLVLLAGIGGTAHTFDSFAPKLTATNHVYGLAFAPVDRDVLLASTQLPGSIHGDPVDRILVASAIAADIPLVTADRTILDYADATGALSACDARP
jgi:PIN domain nuclease of toxin-antitoxin system